MTDSDPFRFCVFCGADCHIENVEHSAECPSVTGVYPVRVEKHCPSCTCDGTIFCCRCDAELKIGDHYMLHELEPGDASIPGIEGASVSEVICVGCAGQTMLDF